MSHTKWSDILLSKPGTVANVAAIRKEMNDYAGYWQEGYLEAISDVVLYLESEQSEGSKLSLTDIIETVRKFTP